MFSNQLKDLSDYPFIKHIEEKNFIPFYYSPDQLLMGLTTYNFLGLDTKDILDTYIIKIYGLYGEISKCFMENQDGTFRTKPSLSFIILNEFKRYFNDYQHIPKSILMPESYRFESNDPDQSMPDIGSLQLEQGLQIPDIGSLRIGKRTSFPDQNFKKLRFKDEDESDDELSDRRGDRQDRDFNSFRLSRKSADLRHRSNPSALRYSPERRSSPSFQINSQERQLVRFRRRSP